MEINGLPVHPLVVHLAVVFVPAAALVGVAYAGVPRWRWATRLPLMISSVVALASAGAAVLSGWNLKDRLYEAGTVPAGLAMHEERAQVLFWVTACFVVFAFAAAWGLGGPSGLASGRGARGKHDPFIEWSLVVGLVLLAGLMLAMTVSTGDAGARAVWGGLSV